MIFLNNSELKTEKKPYSTVTSQELQKLDREGYLILKRDREFWKSMNIEINEVIELVEKYIKEFQVRMDKSAITDDTYKYEEGTNRISNLLGKNKIFQKFVAIPDIIACVKLVLGEKFQLSSFGLREPFKGFGQQGLHLDWKQRKSISDPFYQLTAFILLDNVDFKNGPPRIIPGSHNNMVNIVSTSRFKGKRKHSDNIVIEKKDKEESISLTGKTGDIFFINVNAFHGGSLNKSGKRRRLLHLDYRARYERPQLDHYDAIPKEYHSNFTPYERYLLKLKRKGPKDKFIRFLYHKRDNFLISKALKLKKIINL